MKSVNVLTAIRWIKEAWDRVKPETIRRCFKTCGINLDGTEDQPPGDPFADIQESLDGLVKQIDSACTSEEYLNADDDLCTCQSYDIDGEASNWREQLRAIACASVEDDEPSDVEISSEDDEPKPEKVPLVHTKKLLLWQMIYCYIYLKVVKKKLLRLWGKS